MKKKEGKSRLSLTILFALMVFSVLFVSLAVAIAVTYVLTILDLMPDSGNSVMNTLSLLAFMALISLLVGAGTAIFAGKIPMRPLNLLITQMNRLASGDFKARIHFEKPMSSHSTFQEISDSFNTMAQELEKTEMLRGDFINNFSHEFKTPIVSIAGFAKLLRRGNLTDGQKEEYLAIIEEESMRLASMATNVLNLTKIENQTILTDISVFNLSEQLRSCVLLLESEWTGKEIELDLEFSEHDIKANEELLKHVWINLLDNAIKFSHVGGEIVVRIEEEEDTVSVSVTNFGEEIPPDQIDKIWGKFYQADLSHGSKGNGVGLAVVKQVVYLHKGTVSAKSENGVTTFTVALPKL